MGRGQAQHCTRLHEQICSHLQKLLIKGGGQLFCYKRNSCHTPKFVIFVIVSKIASAMLCLQGTISSMTDRQILAYINSNCHYVEALKPVK